MINNIDININNSNSSCHVEIDNKEMNKAIKFNVFTTTKLKLINEIDTITAYKDEDKAIVEAILDESSLIMAIDSEGIRLSKENEQLVSILENDKLISYIEMIEVVDNETARNINYNLNIEDENIIIQIQEVGAKSKVKLRISAIELSNKAAYVDTFDNIEYWYDNNDKCMYQYDGNEKSIYFRIPEEVPVPNYAYQSPKLIAKDKVVIQNGYEDSRIYSLIDGNLVLEKEVDYQVITRLTKELLIGIKAENYYYDDDWNTIYDPYCKYDLLSNNLDILDSYEIRAKEGATSIGSIYYLTPMITSIKENYIYIALVHSSTIGFGYHDGNYHLCAKVNIRDKCFDFQEIRKDEVIILNDEKNRIIYRYLEKKYYINDNQISSALFSSGYISSVIATSDKLIALVRVNAFNYTAVDMGVYDIESGEIYSVYAGKNNAMSLNSYSYSFSGGTDNKYDYIDFTVPRTVRQTYKDDYITGSKGYIYDSYVDLDPEGYIYLKIKDYDKNIRYANSFFNNNYIGYYDANVGDKKAYPMFKINKRQNENLKIKNIQESSNTFELNRSFIFEEEDKNEEKLVEVTIATKRMVSSSIDKRASTNRGVIALNEKYVESLRKVVCNNDLNSKYDTNRLIIKNYIKTFDSIVKITKGKVKFLDTMRIVSVNKRICKSFDTKRIVYKPGELYIPQLNITYTLDKGLLRLESQEFN